MSKLLNNDLNLLISSLEKDIKQKYQTRIKELIKKYQTTFLEHLNDELKHDVSIMAMINQKVAILVNSPSFQNQEFLHILEKIDNKRTSIIKQIIIRVEDFVFSQISWRLLTEYKRNPMIPVLLQ